MKRTVASLSAAILGTSLWATSAFAAQAGGFVGAGVAFAPDYEGSDELEVQPALFGQYTWEGGQFVKLGGANSSGRAASLRANLIPESFSPIWQFGPVLQFRPERDDVDNNRVDNMKDVDSAFEAGVFGGFATGPWSANLTFAADVSDEHDGYILTLDGAYDLAVNDDLELTFGAAATYADDDYMETYFSVNPGNAARSGLRVYDADSGIKDIGLKFGARYRINPSWGVLGSFYYFRMLDDAEDSPLVDDVGDEDQPAGVIAVTYSF